jgi:hypothetical protein
MASVSALLLKYGAIIVTDPNIGTRALSDDKMKVSMTWSQHFGNYQL